LEPNRRKRVPVEHLTNVSRETSSPKVLLWIDPFESQHPPVINDSCSESAKAKLKSRAINRKARGVEKTAGGWAEKRNFSKDVSRETSRLNFVILGMGEFPMLGQARL
jgi:hypothetical protein